MNKPDNQSNNICSICGDTFSEYGNNAQPINDGRCCNQCNQIVIFRRIKDMQRARLTKDPNPQ